MLCLLRYASPRPAAPAGQAPLLASNLRLQQSQLLRSELVQPGKNVRIMCIVDRSMGGFRGWHNPRGQKIRGSTRAQRIYVENRNNKVYTLIVQRVQVGDGGRYRCTGSRGSKSFDLHVAFTINARPQQTIGPLRGTDKIKLGTKGFPMPSFWWKKDSNGLNFRSGRYSIGMDGSLTIKNIQASDAGTYTCIINQLQGRNRRVERIEVSVTPSGKNTAKQYRVEENGGAKILEGDILLDNSTKEIFDNLIVGRLQSGEDAINNPVRHWPDGIVPYQFGGVSSRVRTAWQQAIEEFNRFTCIKFVRRTYERDYVNVISRRGCWSSIGRSGGGQSLSLGRGCEYKGTAVHEMMHALGFFHEQSRLDRDSHITINWQNIRTDMRYNFQKYRHGVADTLGAPYDYGSIMHYPAYAFTVNGRPTISMKRRSGSRIGQRRGLSKVDIDQVNKLYKCGRTRPIRPVVRPKITPPPPPTTPKPTLPPCRDINIYCGIFSQLGYCRYRPYFNWMWRNCKRSCRHCGY